MLNRRSLVKTWVAKLPPPSKELREGYTRAWTEEQCVAWGERTSAQQVLRQVERWLGPVANARDGDALPYSKRRLAWLAELASQLEDAIAAVELPPDTTLRDELRRAAELVRNRALARAELLVGGDENRASDLKAAWLDGRDGAAVVKSLRALVKVLTAWRKERGGAALADDVGVTRDFLDALTTAADRLDAELFVHLGVSRRVADAPATNAVEGRVLRELRALQLAVIAAREDRLQIRALRVLPGLRAFLAPQSARKKKGKPAEKRP